MRRGDLDSSYLTDDEMEAIRLHDVVALTHWTLDEIAETPSIVIDRLLLVRNADIEAQRPRS